MQIDEILCSDEILEKLNWKHHVSEDEVYEVLLFGKPHFRFVEKGNVKGEDLYFAYGRTDAGRYLKILFIYKTNRKALILSARDMSPRERRRYA